MSRRTTRTDVEVGSAPAELMGASAEMAGDTAAADMDRERVARRAYELYLARGGADGQADDDWYTAERELGSTREEE